MNAEPLLADGAELREQRANLDHHLATSAWLIGDAGTAAAADQREPSAAHLRAERTNLERRLAAVEDPANNPWLLRDGIDQITFLLGDKQARAATDVGTPSTRELVPAHVRSFLELNYPCACPPEETDCPGESGEADLLADAVLRIVAGVAA